MANELDEAMASQYTGNFLDASDIMKRGTISLTISGVVAPGSERDASGKAIKPAIVSFEKAKKRLVLNKTNQKVIAMSHGSKASEWTGKQITLCVRYLAKAFGQSNVPVIRVVPPDGIPLPWGVRDKYGSEKPFGPQRETSE